MVDTWKNKLYFGDNLDIMREYIPGKGGLNCDLEHLSSRTTAGGSMVRILEIVHHARTGL